MSSPPKLSRERRDTDSAEAQDFDNTSECSRSRTVGSIADSGYGSECTLQRPSEDDKRSLTSNGSIRASYESDCLTPVSRSSVAKDSSIKHSLHKAASKTCKLFSDTIRSKTQLFYVAPVQTDSPITGKEESPSKRLEKIRSVVSLRGRGAKQSASDHVDQESPTRTSASVNLPHELDVDIPDSNLRGLTLDVRSSDEVARSPVGSQSETLFPRAKDLWSNAAANLSINQTFYGHEASGASSAGASLPEFDISTYGLQSKSYQNTKDSSSDGPKGCLTLNSPCVEPRGPFEVNFEHSGSSPSTQTVRKNEEGGEGIHPAVNLGDPLLEQSDSGLRYALEAIERPNGDILDATDGEFLMDTSTIQNAIDAIDRLDDMTSDYSDDRQLLSLKSIQFAIEAIDRPNGTMLEDSAEPRKANSSIPIAKYRRQVKRSGSRRVLKRSPTKSQENKSKPDDISTEKRGSPLLETSLLKNDPQGQIALETHGSCTDGSEDATLVFSQRTPSSQSVSTSDSCAVTTHSPKCYITPPPAPLHLRTHPVRRTSSIINEANEALDGLKDRESFLGPSKDSERHSAQPFTTSIEAQLASPTKDTTYVASGHEEVGGRDIEVLPVSPEDSQIEKQALVELQAGSSLNKEIRDAFLRLKASVTTAEVPVDLNDKGIVKDSKTRSSSMCAPDGDFKLDFNLGQRPVIKRLNTRSSSMCAPDEDFMIDPIEPEACVSPKPILTVDTDTLRYNNLKVADHMETLSLTLKSEEDNPALKVSATSSRDAKVIKTSIDEIHVIQKEENYTRKHDTLSYSVTQQFERTVGPASTPKNEPSGSGCQVFEDHFNADELPPLPPPADTPYASQLSTGSPVAPEFYCPKVLIPHDCKQRWMSSIRTSSLDGPLNSPGFSADSTTTLVPISKFVNSLSDYFKSKGENKRLCTPQNSPQKPEDDQRQCVDYSSSHKSGVQIHDNPATEGEFVAARLPRFRKEEAHEVVETDANTEPLNQKRASVLTSPTHESGSSIPIASRLNRSRSVQGKKRSGEELPHGPLKTPKKDLVTSSMKKGVWWGRNSKVAQEAESPLAHRAEESSTNKTVREDVLTLADHSDPKDPLGENKENKGSPKRARQVC